MLNRYNTFKRNTSVDQPFVRAKHFILRPFRTIRRKRIHNRKQHNLLRLQRPILRQRHNCRRFHDLLRLRRLLRGFFLRTFYRRALRRVT